MFSVRKTVLSKWRKVRKPRGLPFSPVWQYLLDRCVARVSPVIPRITVVTMIAMVATSGRKSAYGVSTPPARNGTKAIELAATRRGALDPPKNHRLSAPLSGRGSFLEWLNSYTRVYTKHDLCKSCIRLNTGLACCLASYRPALGNSWGAASVSGIHITTCTDERDSKSGSKAPAHSRCWSASASAEKIGGVTSMPRLASASG